MAAYRKLTDKEREKVAELYNTHKYTRAQLANMYGVSKNTINRIVTDTDYKVALKQPNTKFTPAEEVEVARLYRDGKPIKHIAEILGRSLTSVYNCAVRLGIHVSKGNNNQSSNVTGSEVVQKVTEAIHPEDISELRAKLKIGDIIQVRSLKSLSDALSNGNSGYGIMKDARVISVDNPRFCLVELVGSGVMDSVLWADLIMRHRRTELIEEIVANG